jgi:hypothetical protein
MPGLIEDSTDMKILILFAMRKLGMPATIEAVTEMTVGLPGTMVSYFDVAAALGALVDTEHLTLELAKYELTKKGIRNGEITEEDVPYSLRRHSERIAIELRSRMMREKLIRTSRTIMRSGGYEVEMKMSDGKNDVLFLRVMAINEKQAQQVEDAFSERAESVFTTIMNALLG